jgi:four helix bundle protein
MSDSDFPSTYDEWLDSVPEVTKKSSVWRLRVYQLALFVFQVAQRDIETLKQKKARPELVNQLYRAAGSIPANIVEGYGRNSGKERRHFFEVALGSAREVDLWYQESERG